MRKVKFTQDSFDEKLGAILADFPILDVRSDYTSSTKSLFMMLLEPASVSLVLIECAI